MLKISRRLLEGKEGKEGKEGTEGKEGKEGKEESRRVGDGERRGVGEVGGTRG